MWGVMGRAGVHAEGSVLKRNSSVSGSHTHVGRDSPVGRIVAFYKIPCTGKHLKAPHVRLG
jgi:hypothetical protein